MTGNIDANQPKMTCTVLTWTNCTATQIHAIYTLVTFTFHTPWCDFWRLYSTNIAFQGETSPSLVITQRQGDLPAAGGLEKIQNGHFDPYFHILNTWLTLLPTKCECSPNCSARLFRQCCQPTVRQGCWSVPVLLINDSLAGHFTETASCFLFIGTICKATSVRALKSHNQQSATGINMFQLILNEKCAISPPFLSRAANEENQNSIFQCTGDRFNVLKFKCEHEQSTLKPPNTNPVNGKMSKMPVRFQMAF